MHDIAIVGGGLCGLALLRLLSGSGLDVVLFEARARLGGRVLSVPARGGHPGGDLGPGWYWPDTQPLLNGLITELGLRTFAQHDQGISLYVGGPDQPPASLGERPVHDGARRIDGGMGRIIEGLAHALPPARLQTGCWLHRLRDHGDHVELGFTDTAFGRTVRARHVVLALPPRLIDETLAFEPALPAELRAAMRDTPTWMAAQAKLLAACEQPVWRVFGCSGNAFVRHAQAVVGEVFDACDAAGTRAALGGFVTPPAALRRQIDLPAAVIGEFAKLFGPTLRCTDFALQDWAAESLTCSRRDREQAESVHPGDAPLLRLPYWGGRLLFGGSETAARHAGYLEGALLAAARLAGELGRLAMTGTAVQAVAAPAAEREATLERLRACLQAPIADWRAGLLAEYRRQLHVVLSGPHGGAAITQRALLGTIGTLYVAALDALVVSEAQVQGVAIERGRSALTPPLLACFEGCNDALIATALEFNRGSCALSNFPQEHQPSAETLHAIRLDLAAAWREFALTLNARLLPRSVA